MGYLHIQNLYKNQEILLFKECYALEKIHGTSAHISYIPPATNSSTGRLTLSSGGESHERFSKLFNELELFNKIREMYPFVHVTIYGEAYGGKQQDMTDVYGQNLKFIAFDVCLNESNWLNVPEAAQFCKSIGIEFVHFVKISTDLKDLDAERDADSEQAIRNGVGSGKKREGVVLRPLIELTKNGGDRIITKHKRDEFRETASPRVIDDPVKLKVLEDANNIANEWVTITRLEHVLDKIPNHGMEKIPVIIAAMVEDVAREAKGEIVDNETTRKAIRTKTVTMYKDYLKSKLNNEKN